MIDVSPGYKLVRNREQISVTLGDEMFSRKKTLRIGHLEQNQVFQVKSLAQHQFLRVGSAQLASPAWPQ